MSLATDFAGKANEATHTDVSGLSEAAQNVYRKLHSGFTGKGVHRVPIGGDMNKLPFAVGLTTLEKSLHGQLSTLLPIWLVHKHYVKLW
eukprot:1245221-Karenia_brevis.AAC.1